MAQNIVASYTRIDQDTLSCALETAKVAAREAGDFLLQRRGSVKVLHKKSLRDDLLDVDLQVEEIIVHRLRKDFPEFGILSEEVASIDENCPDRWVVDPLDGSFNFQHGNPTFAISISLVLGNTTMLGAVYLPLMDEMFSAIRGHGAFLNGEQIHVSLTPCLNESIIHVGDFAKDGNFYDNQERLHDIAKLANKVGRVRMIGTAATDLAFVACGRAEALVVHNARPWDVEVGLLLVSEAGGKITSIQEEKSGRSLMICSNENVHSQLQIVITKRVSHHSKMHSLSTQIGLNKILKILNWHNFTDLRAF